MTTGVEAMESDDIYASFHQRNQIVREAIKDAAHDAACRVHHTVPYHRIEWQLRRISREVTDQAKRTKKEIS